MSPREHGGRPGEDVADGVARAWQPLRAVMPTAPARSLARERAGAVGTGAGV
ncbi:hypothetical protein GCM10010501_57700 [Streptomyces libani subsp. rufus]|nr:hypothetical protein GCM10010501_57700 [Streptomyces libani subsp. rufus]